MHVYLRFEVLSTWIIFAFELFASNSSKGKYEDPNAIYNAVLHSSRNPFDSSGKLSLTIPTWFASKMLLQSLFNFEEIAKSKSGINKMQLYSRVQINLTLYLNFFPFAPFRYWANYYAAIKLEKFYAVNKRNVELWCNGIGFVISGTVLGNNPGRGIPGRRMFSVRLFPGPSKSSPFLGKNNQKT